VNSCNGFAYDDNNVNFVLIIIIDIITTIISTGTVQVCVFFMIST